MACSLRTHCTACRVYLTNGTAQSRQDFDGSMCEAMTLPLCARNNHNQHTQHIAQTPHTHTWYKSQINSQLAERAAAYTPCRITAVQPHDLYHLPSTGVTIATQQTHQTWDQKISVPEERALTAHHAKTGLAATATHNQQSPSQHLSSACMGEPTPPSPTLLSS